MITIAIKHVGPLVDTGVVEAARFNIVIGKQSTGKSTLMKILCFCQWLEKRMMTGEDKLLSSYTHYSRFLKELKQFHRFNDHYFTSKSEIHYQGECIAIDLEGNKNVRITKYADFEEKRHNTKLSFIPSERNLVSAIKHVDRAYRSNDNDVLFNHIFEWSEAKEHTSERRPVDLSIVGDMEYYYDARLDSDTIQLRGRRNKIVPFYASSGVQSVLPILVMTDYLTDSVFSDSIDLSRKNVSDLFRRLSGRESDSEGIINKVSQIYNYQNTRLFIEEPEQNLFPASQQELIEYMVGRINRASAHTQLSSSMMLTTHSPYVITAFNVLLRAAQAATLSGIEETTNPIAADSRVQLDDLRAYYVTEEGLVNDIVDREIGMISGVELDKTSEQVENRLAILNTLIYGRTE